jgi:hypothetical protein
MIWWGFGGDQGGGGGVTAVVGFWVESKGGGV